jgi:hypothetical protein
VEVWTRRGLQRFIVLFLIDLATRKVEIAGIATAAHRSEDRRQLELSLDGLFAVLTAHHNPQSLYHRLWVHLERKGLRQRAPEKLRGF